MVTPGTNVMQTPATQTENKASKSSKPNEKFFGKGQDMPFFQAKLTVNQPGDLYEQEADQVADQVMRMPDPVQRGEQTEKNGAAPVDIQRKAVPASPAPVEVKQPAATPVLSRVQPSLVQAKCAECSQKEKEQKEEEHQEGKTPVMRATKIHNINGTSMVPVQRACAECAKEETAMRKEKQPAIDGSAPVQIQRACAECGPEEEMPAMRKENSSDAGGQAAPAIVSDVISSGAGRPIDAGTRDFMESRFGQDFGQVRIHTDAQAAESASAINARAYTSGNNVVFGGGEYQPETDSGRRLLAHELVHVGQQENSLIQPKGKHPSGDQGDLTAEKKEMLKKKLKLINYVEFDNPNIFYSINTNLLNKFWDTFYSSYFFDEFGIEKDNKPLSWHEFNAKYVVQQKWGRLTLELPIRKNSLPEEENNLIEINNESDDNILPQENSSDQTIEEPGEATTDKGQVKTSISWNYTEYQYITKNQFEIDKETWIPKYPAASDPVYGKDVKLFVDLSPAQKEYYNWNEIRKQWREVNFDADIGNKTLDQWIRKHLQLGWKTGDDIPHIKAIKVKYDNEIPTIQSFSFTDAFRRAGELGLIQGAHSKFNWERKITGETTSHLYDLAPPEIYYNRTHLEKLSRIQYIEYMHTILENDELYKKAMAESEFGEHFAYMVKRVQMRLNEGPDGMLTPAMIGIIKEKADAIKQTKEQNQKEVLEAQSQDEIKKSEWNKPKWTYDGIAADGFRKVYRYKWRDYEWTVALSPKFMETVNKANSNANVDWEVHGLTNNEILALPLNVRKKCIKLIADDWSVPYDDEKSIYRLLEYVPQDQYDDITSWFNTPEGMEIFKDIKKEIEHDDLRRKFNNLMADRYSEIKEGNQLLESETIKKSLLDDYKSFEKEIIKNSNSADSEAYRLSKQLMKQLEYLHHEYDEKTGDRISKKIYGVEYKIPSLRIQAIKVVVNGFLVGDEDEETLTDLLVNLPENEVVAKQVRKEIAHSLLDHRIFQFTTLWRLHEFTHGKEYKALRAALDTIYKENGNLLAGRIKEKLDDPSKDFTHLEYFSAYASKEVFKYLDDEYKFKLIDAILKGLWEGGDDEEAIIAILESVGLEEEIQAQKADSEPEYERLMEMSKTKKQSFSNKILYGDNSKKYLEFWESFHGDNYIKLERLLNEMDVEHSEARKNLANKYTDNSSKRKYIKFMSDSEVKNLSIEERKYYLNILAEIKSGGWTQFWIWTGDAEESAVARIISFTPKGQANALIDWLFGDKSIYPTIHSAIDGVENTQFHDALVALRNTKVEEDLFSPDQEKELNDILDSNTSDPLTSFENEKRLNQLLEIKEKNTSKNESELKDLTNKKTKDRNVFFWSHRGMWDQEEYNFDYSTELIDTDTGVKLKVVKTLYRYGQIAEENAREEIVLDPMEMISIYFEEDLDGIAKAGETLVKPAIYLNLLGDAAFKEDLWDVIDLIALLLSFIPFLNAGLAGLAKVLAYIDAVITAMGIVVTQNKDKLPIPFVEAFRALEIATIGFAFVKTPKAINEAAEQLAKLDEAVNLISKMDNIPQALKDNVKLIQKVFEKQLEMGKNINKADAATLKKLLSEIDAAGTGGKKFNELRDAILKRLDNLEGKAVKTADDVATAKEEAAEAIFNAGQKAKALNAAREITVTKTVEKTGEVITKGRTAEIKNAAGQTIAEIEFPNSKSLEDWLAYNSQKRYIDPGIDAIDPMMHPWFFRNGKQVNPEHFPHLFDAGKKPLGIHEIFGQGKEGATKLALLNSIGDLKASLGGKLYSGVDPELMFELGKVAYNYLKHYGSIAKESFVKFLKERNVNLNKYSDEAVQEFLDNLDRLKIFEQALTNTGKQQAFIEDVLRKLLSGDIDDEMAEKLIRYNNETPKGNLSVDDVIENFREGMIFNEGTKRFRTAVDEVVQTIEEAIPNFSGLSSRERSLAVLATSEPDLANALKMGKLDVNPKLKETIEGILNNHKFNPKLELPVERRKLVKDLNRAIGEGVEDISEFEKVISFVSYSKGSIGEYFAKKLLTEKGEKIVSGRTIKVENLGFINKSRVNPDQLIFNVNSGRIGEIKTGYHASNISLDQIENYLKLIEMAENPKIANQLQAFGLPKGAELSGIDYLFLPGGKNLSAKDAARKAFKQIERYSKKAEDALQEGVIQVKYVDDDGIIQIIKP